MTDALEAGDNTFTRSKPTPTPPGLDYTCGCCGRRIGHEKWGVYVDPDLKLVLTAHCCDRSVQLRLYLGMGGTA